jgi:hypothetical protein
MGKHLVYPKWLNDNSALAELNKWVCRVDRFRLKCKLILADVVIVDIYEPILA